VKCTTSGSKWCMSWARNSEQTIMTMKDTTTALTRGNRLGACHDSQGEGHSRYDFGLMARRYECWYDTPTGRAHDHEQKALVRRFLPSQVKPGDRLLDVGCGTGHWSRFFAAEGFDVLGVDIFPEMIQVARLYDRRRCHFLLADAEELPFQDRSFDVVTAIATIEFVTHPKRAVAEMSRCTRPGGRFIVATLNRMAPLNRCRVARGTEPYASAHMLSPSELRGLLTPYGQVRMRVTEERFSRGRVRSLLSLWQRVGFKRKYATGALIIAEVRL